MATTKGFDVMLGEIPVTYLGNLTPTPEKSINTVRSDTSCLLSTPVPLEKSRFMLFGQQHPDAIDFFGGVSHNNLHESGQRQYPLQDQNEISFANLEGVSEQQVTLQMQNEMQFSNFKMLSQICSTEQRVIASECMGSELGPISEDQYAQAVDLNKTSQQKPRRKKHRPKVVREGKLARTPKPQKEQQKTPVNPSGKRKYVRKKNVSSSNSTPAPTDTAYSNNNVKTPEVYRSQMGTGAGACSKIELRPVKRCLNFNSDVQASGSFQLTSTENRSIFPNCLQDSSSSSRVGYAQGSCCHFPAVVSHGRREEQVYGYRVPINMVEPETRRYPGSMIADSQAQETMVLSTTTSAILHPGSQQFHRPEAFKNGAYNGVTVDLNRPPFQMHDKNVRIVPQIQRDGNLQTNKILNCATPSQGSADFVSSIHQMQKMFTPVEQAAASPLPDFRSRNTVDKQFFDAYLHAQTGCVTSLHAAKRKMVGENSTLQLRTNNYSRIGADSNMQLPVHFRKYGSYKFSNNNVTRNNQFPSHINRGRSIVGTDACFVDNRRDIVNQQQHLSVPAPCCPSVNKRMRMEGDKSSETPSACHSSASVDIHSSDYQLYHVPQRNSASNYANTQWLLNFENSPSCGKSRAPVPLQPAIVVSTINQHCVEARNLPDLVTSPLVNDGAPEKVVQPLNAKNPVAKDVEGKPKKKRGRKPNKPSISATITKGAREQYDYLLDDVIQKLECLDMNKRPEKVSDLPQNALVPYVGGSTAIVPYGETKKRRSRAKVDLDPVTNHVWKLLMGKEMADGMPEIEGDKEKWLEEERNIFRGRIDSFIARMHLVQGDRRFSPWKGSVVDSVVGVFLTQNVSDHLSSSAFMSLAAKFPIRVASVDSKSISSVVTECPEQDDNIVTVDDNARWQDKILSEKASDKELAFTAEEKEVCTSNESFGSNSGNGVMSFSIGDCPIMETAHNELHYSAKANVAADMGILNAVDAEDRSLEDGISSQNSAISSRSSPDHLLHAPDRTIGSCSLEGLLGNIFNGSGFTSYTELLRMAESSEFNHILSSSEHRGESDSFLFYSVEMPPPAPKNIISERYPSISNPPDPGKGHLSDMSNTYLDSTQNSHLHDNISCCSTIPSRNFSEVQQGDASKSSSRRQEDRTSQILQERGYSHDAQGRGENQRLPIVEVNGRTSSEVVQSLAPTSDHKGPSDSSAKESKVKRGRLESAKKKAVDWDSLRKDAPKKDRTHETIDSIDWEAVRSASVNDISETIRERGMNNLLAQRIKEFLHRLVNDHGSIDLEWLRNIEPDKSKDYLLSIHGLGLKSVECVRLLTLHHLAFPVDTNVGRICVRLGWVPLQPLPESLQLHLLELYPVLENIQKYLWPRLCKLDQRTLYELHYQMITFGKVFCTKSKPNCNACPMRAECKHFASAFASARLALPAPEDKRVMTTSTKPNAMENGCGASVKLMALPPLVESGHLQEPVASSNHEPIVEEPASPEPKPECIKESAYEDAFIEDPDEIPTIRLNVDEFTRNLKSYIEANNIEIEDADMSKALVAISPVLGSLPVPKLKSTSRLRTEHQVYELPDSHPLLREFDKREPDDPSPYLLSIWTPGETAQSIEAPKSLCNPQQTGQCCGKMSCCSCSSMREQRENKVRGTILIPCRTAMRGSFPLNGTYFQVNEVFADHQSSHNPMDVDRGLIWNLPRRTVYFGTSVPTIFRGLATEQIQHCFWRGFVCVRGFERATRAPRALYPRLHFPASKVIRSKKGAPAAKEA